MSFLIYLWPFALMLVSFLLLIGTSPYKGVNFKPMSDIERKVSKTIHVLVYIMFFLGFMTCAGFCDVKSKQVLFVPDMIVRNESVVVVIRGEDICFSADPFLVSEKDDKKLAISVTYNTRACGYTHRYDRIKPFVVRRNQ